MTEASAPFSRAKRIAHSVFMFYSKLHALCPMRFIIYAAGRSDRMQRGSLDPASAGSDALMVDQGLVPSLTQPSLFFILEHLNEENLKFT
jgi:hypothetical protein